MQKRQQLTHRRIIVMMGFSQSGLYYAAVLRSLLIFSPAVVARFRLTKRFKSPFLPDSDTEPCLPSLKSGTIYLLKGRDLERPYTLFVQEVKKKGGGFLITRRSPSRVKDIYNLTDVSVLWLSQKEEENVLSPTQLHKLAYLISETVHDQKDTVILLDGLEYLIVHNRFDRVLKQLYVIREVLSHHGGVLLIPLDPEALSEKELGFLEKESVLI
jgi:hypothetical protein